ncbi:hypothetical protein Tco_1047439 [Tanacetum coccineum]
MLLLMCSYCYHEDLQGCFVMRSSNRFIEDVIMKMIEYCLFDVVVKFHRHGELPKGVMMNPSSMITGVESSCFTTVVVSLLAAVVSFASEDANPRYYTSRVWLCS